MRQYPIKVWVAVIVLSVAFLAAAVYVGVQSWRHPRGYGTYTQSGMVPAPPSATTQTAGASGEQRPRQIGSSATLATLRTQETSGPVKDLQGGSRDPFRALQQRVADLEGQLLGSRLGSDSERNVEYAGSDEQTARQLPDPSRSRLSAHYPVLWFPFDRGYFQPNNPAAPVDLGGKHAAIPRGTRPTKGRMGDALQFNPACLVVVPNLSRDLDMSAICTMAAWVRPERAASLTGTTQTIMSRGATPQQNAVSYRLGLTPWNAPFLEGRVPPGGSRFGNWTCRANRPLKAGVWQHLCVVYNQGEITFYVDGQPIPQTRAPENIRSLVPVSNPQARLYIGAQFLDERSGDIRDPLLGSLDDVALWNRALDADEVESLTTDRDTNNVADYWHWLRDGRRPTPGSMETASSDRSDRETQGSYPRPVRLGSSQAESAGSQYPSGDQRYSGAPSSDRSSSSYGSPYSNRSQSASWPRNPFLGQYPYAAQSYPGSQSSNSGQSAATASSDTQPTPSAASSSQPQASPTPSGGPARNYPYGNPRPPASGRSGSPSSSSKRTPRPPPFNPKGGAGYNPNRSGPASRPQIPSGPSGPGPSGPPPPPPRPAYR